MSVNEICAILGLILTIVAFFTGRIGYFLKKISDSYEKLKKQQDDMKEELACMSSNKVSREELERQIDRALQPIQNNIADLKVLFEKMFDKVVEVRVRHED